VTAPNLLTSLGRPAGITFGFWADLGAHRLGGRHALPR